MIRFRDHDVLTWLLAGVVIAIMSRWLGRSIPLDWPAGVRLATSSGLLLGLAVLAAGLRYQLDDLLNWFLERLPRQRSTLVMATLLIWVLSGIILMKNSHYVRHDEPSGDEPEYLMLTRSLIDDRDFELEVDKATLVCKEFMHDRFVLHIRSVRPPGLPVLLMPAYLAGRHLPWPGLPHSVYLFMGLLYVILGSQLFLLIQAATDRPRLAVAVTLTAMLTPPLIPFSFQIYPEVPAALLVVFLFRREFYEAPDRNRWLDGIMLALIPAFHQKYMFLFIMSFAHILSGVWTNRKRNPGSWIAILLPSAVTLAYLSVFFGRRFGVWLPTAPYELNEGLLSKLLTGQTLRAVLGQFFDRKWGLFAVNPLLLFAIPGIYAVWRRRPWMWVWWFALTGGFVVLVSAYPMWWGGFCPVSRFILPVVPFMWVGVARLAASQRSRSSFLTVTGIVLLALAGYFSFLTMAGSPFKTQNVSPYQYPEESPNGSSLWAAASTCVDWNSVLPAIERNGKWNHILPDALQFGKRDAVELAGFTCLVLLWSLLVIRFGQRSSDRTSDYSFVFAPLLFLAAGFGFLMSERDDTSLILRQRSQRELTTLRAESPDSPGDVWKSLPGVYGPDTGEWLGAPDVKFNIFYPPIYIQDMPDILWPGGYRYRFNVPVRWLPAADKGKIGFSVENLLTRQKQIAETVATAGTGVTNLEVICPVDPGQKAMFKIILYADTSQYEYRGVRVAVRPFLGSQ